MADVNQNPPAGSGGGTAAVAAGGQAADKGAGAGAAGWQSEYKTPEEMHEALTKLKKTVGDQGNQLGTWRKTFNDFADLDEKGYVRGIKSEYIDDGGAVATATRKAPDTVVVGSEDAQIEKLREVLGFDADTPVKTIKAQAKLFGLLINNQISPIQDQIANSMNEMALDKLTRGESREARLARQYEEQIRETIGRCTPEQRRMPNVVRTIFNLVIGQNEQAITDAEIQTKITEGVNAALTQRGINLEGGDKSGGGGMYKDEDVEVAPQQEQYLRDNPHIDRARYVKGARIKLNAQRLNAPGSEVLNRKFMQERINAQKERAAGGSK